MTKPTGRPRGRPKTKEYVTLMARVDITLADEVKRYASLHRQPISVVIRDALTLLMEEYPFAADRSGPHRLAAHEFLSDRYESPLDTLIGEADSAELENVLSDTNEEAVESMLSDTSGEDEYASDVIAVMTAFMSDSNTPAYDTSKHYLGKLCPRRHDYNGTGQSLLRKTNHLCLACDRERAKERRQAKRTAARV
jgi:hypothetical protein